MIHSRARLTLSAALLVLAACAPTSEPEPDTTAADMETIREHTAQAVAAFNAEDAATAVAHWADDAVRMPPTELDLVGRAAMQRSNEELFAELSATQTASVDEVQVFGDVAFSRGTWRMLQTPKAGGDEVERNGKWLIIHQRQSDGQWKGIRHIWNERD